MRDYKKVKKIQKLSNLVGCMIRVQPEKLELLLLLSHIVIIVLCTMNLLIIPWKVVNNEIKILRIVIASFFIISLICVTYNQIERKRQNLTIGYYYCVSFFGSIISQILIIINFILLMISCILVTIKVKKYLEKIYDHKSILIIDIFSIIIVIAMIFLWYYVFLTIYAKTYESLNEYIETKMRFIQSQNQKVVNIDFVDDNNMGDKKNMKIFKDVKNFSVDDEIMSANKVEITDKRENESENSQKKEHDSSIVETK